MRKNRYGLCVCCEKSRKGLTLWFIAVPRVVGDTGRDAGGAQIEDEDAVFVNVGVVEADGLREMNAVFARQAVGVDDFAAAAARVCANAVGVSRGERCGF